MHYPVPVERLPTLWSFWLPLSLLLCRSIPLWPRTVTSRLVWGAMERRKKWRGSRRDEEAMHEGREAWENSMGAQDGSRVEDLVFKVFCVCVSDQYAQKGGYTFLCECGFCVRAYFCVFVFVCVHVCFHVCRVVCEWGRALKERSTAGGHSWFHHPSARLKLPQKLLLFSQRLSASFPCSLSFLMSFSPSFSSHCVFSAFSSISPFSSRQGSPSLPLSLSPRSSVDLHHFCPHLPLVLFDCISNLRLFFSGARLLFTPCLSVSAFTFSQSFSFPSFLPLSVKWCWSTKCTFWIETFRCERTNTRSCTQANTVGKWREDYCNMK